MGSDWRLQNCEFRMVVVLGKPSFERVVSDWPNRLVLND
jgi:hypothetical protein